MNKEKVKKYLNIFGNIISIAAIVYLFWRMCRKGFAVTLSDKLPRITIATLISVIPLTVALFLLGYIWYRSVATLSGKTGYVKKAMLVYGRANLAKYIPGNVFQYIERNAFLSNSGLDQLDMAVSSISEIIGLIVAGVILSLILGAEYLFSLVKFYFTPKIKLFLVIFLIIFIVIVIIALLASKKVKRIMKRIFSKEYFMCFLVNILLYAVALLLIASSMVIIYPAISATPLDIHMIVLIISVYIISWLAGYIIPGAPGGMGVREMAVAFIITNPELKDVLVLVAIFQRIGNILSDVVGFIIGVVLKNKVENNVENTMNND